MSGTDERPSDDLDEFGQIARLYRPLTRGAPEALDLLDDAAVIPSRPGFDLVVTKDAMVEGVHFLVGEAPDMIARKLLRVNLSDLAAKGAKPYGYFLAVAWPKSCDWSARQRFADGLTQDGQIFDLTLLGGDTVSTSGPLTLSLTMLGWVPSGRMIRRGGGRPGDLVMVSGAIGDGFLGLAAARGEIPDADGYLAGRYRLPTPRLDLEAALSVGANAAADVSDGLIADAGHVARASRCGLRLDLDRLPLSPAGRGWLAGQADRTAALVSLASGGDDYEIVCAAPAPLEGFTVVGALTVGDERDVRVDGARIEAGPGGWRHG